MASPPFVVVSLSDYPVSCTDNPAKDATRQIEYELLDERNTLTES